MSEDHKYTKEGKKELFEAVKKVDDHNSKIINTSNELTNSLNKESQFYEDHSKKIHKLYQTLTEDYDNLEKTVSERLYTILVGYAIFILVYRNSLYHYLIDYWFEPYAYVLLLLSSIYLIEVRVMRIMRKRMTKRLREIRSKINKVDDSGRRKIQLLKNDEKMKDLTNEAGQIVGIASLFSEKIKNIIDYLNHQNVAKRTYKNLLICYKKYGLINNTSKLEKIEEPPYTVKGEKALTDFYIISFSKLLEIKGDFLKLLYYEYVYDMQSLRSKWDEIKQNNNIPLIINYLEKYVLIVDVPDLINDEIIDLLYELDIFSISSINQLMENYVQNKNLIKIYLDGLYEEEILDARYAFEKEILYDKTFDYFKEQYDNHFYYKLVYRYINNYLKNIHMEYESYVIKCLIGLISANKYPWILDIACTEIALDDNASDLIFIYQRLKENRGQNITLKDAIFIDDEFKNIQRTDYQTVKEEIIIDLKAGIWVNSTESILKRKMDYIKNQLESIDHDKRKIKSIRTIFASNVSEKTIMQSIDAKTLVAYVINAKYKWGEGGIMDTIDVLKDNSFYLFTDYTPSSRIGILPPGISFIEFTKKFELDFTKKAKGNIGDVIIQRFSTAENNLKQIFTSQELDPPWRIIRHLASIHLSEAELRVVLSYGEVIDHSYFNRTTAEILSNFISNSYRLKQEKILETLESKDIAPFIVGKYRCKNLREFAALVYKNKNKPALINELTSFFNNYYPALESNIIDRLVIEFIEDLQAYWVVYEDLNLE